MILIVLFKNVETDNNGCSEVYNEMMCVSSHIGITTDWICSCLPSWLKLLALLFEGCSYIRKASNISLWTDIQNLIYWTNVWTLCSLHYGKCHAIVIGQLLHVITKWYTHFFTNIVKTWLVWYIYIYLFFYLTISCILDELFVSCRFSINVV